MLYDITLSLVAEMENGDYHTITRCFKQCTRDFTEEKYKNIVRRLISDIEQEYNLRVMRYFPISNEDLKKIKCKKDYIYYTIIEDAKTSINQMKDYYKKINHTLAILKREKEGRDEEERLRFENKFNQNAKLLSDMDFVLLFLSGDGEGLKVSEVKKSMDNLISVTSKNSRRNWRFVLETLRENL